MITFKEGINERRRNSERKVIGIVIPSYIEYLIQTSGVYLKYY
jgi:hypothetical protein